MKFAVLILVILIALTSCGGEYPTPTELVSSIADAVGMSDCAFYSSEEELSSPQRPSDELLKIIYGALPENTEAYAFALSRRSSGGEVHVLLAKYLSERDRLEKLCRERIDSLACREIYGFAPDAYERILSSAKVVTRGRYVILLATADNDAAIRVIEQSLG